MTPLEKQIENILRNASDEASAHIERVVNEALAERGISDACPSCSLRYRLEIDQTNLPEGIEALFSPSPTTPGIADCDNVEDAILCIELSSN